MTTHGLGKLPTRAARATGVSQQPTENERNEPSRSEPIMSSMCNLGNVIESACLLLRSLAGCS
eukprot:1676085-Pleurochrysis_carterae.AAC.1